MEEQAAITPKRVRLTKKATAFQFFFGISAGFAAMTSGAWLGWPAATIPLLKSGEYGFTMTTVEISVLVALMDFGNVLSPIPSSYAMDAVGRKLTLFSSCIMYLISSLCAFFAYNAWWLYIARIFAGLGKGVAFAVIPIYLAEIANIEIRGALSTMFIGFLNIGMFYEYVLGPFLPVPGLDIANVIIPILFAITFIVFPESPYYLFMKGREGSAKKSLIKYRQVKKEEAGVNSPLDNELKIMQTTVENDMKNKARYFDVFATAENRRALLIISALALFQRSSGISPTLAYSTVIMPKYGGGITSSVYMIIFSFILVIANYIATPLVDRWGRKPLLMISSITTGLTTAVAGVYYFLERATDTDVSSIEWIPYACLVIFAVTYSLGIGFIPSTLVGELFPTNVKSYAGSISAIILAATSFIVNNIFYIVAVNWGPHIMYWAFTIAMIGSTLFTHYLVFETKGKTFNEIQQILRNTAGKTSRS